MIRTAKCEMRPPPRTNGHRAGDSPVMAIARDHQTAGQAAGHGWSRLCFRVVARVSKGIAGNVASYQFQDRKSFSRSVKSTQGQAGEPHVTASGLSRNGYWAVSKSSLFGDSV
jgi:hypothetical protein